MAAAAPAFLAISAGLSAVSTASQLFSRPVAPPALPVLPQAPDPKKDAAAAEAAARKAALAARQPEPSGRSSTLLTGPNGLGSAAPTQRKVLLGL